MDQCQRKEKNSPYLILKIVSFSNQRWLGPLSWKISWIWLVVNRLVRQFSYWENLLLFWMMLNKVSFRIWTFSGNNSVKKRSHPINNLVHSASSRYKRKAKILKNCYGDEVASIYTYWNYILLVQILIDM